MRLAIKGDYPANWREIATAAKDAAGWKCIRCDHRHDAESGHILTVHHLDGDKSNCRWWNLLALCQRCHLKVQARVIPERPWLFEHTAWFRPYVGGFYAWHHNSEEPTREEVEANIGYYLALGQPWLYESGTSPRPTDTTARHGEGE